MAEILDPDKLRSKALKNGQPTSTSINIRRLIDRILTHYSSDFVVFRELIQNADDAGATSFHLEIKCDTSPASSAEMNFNNRTITEIRAINNGHVFSTADWQRVATIADGNIDPESVGQFGVGFFSVFSYTEEPIIVSGKEYMIFIWQDNKFLQTLHHKLLVEQQTNTTSIILKMRDKYILRIESILDNSRITNEDVPTINLTQLKAYFAKALSFTRNMMTLDIKVNQLLVFQMSKTKSNTSSILNPFTFKPHRSIHNMLLLDSFVFTEQTFAITNGPSITLGHIAIEAHLNIDQQLRNYFQRILKTLPSTVQIQLLFVPTKILLNQQQFQSLIANNNLDAQILKSILPLKFLDNEIIPSGLIFIGLGTHQSIGIGMHVCSHFIPTVERDTLDLQDAYAAKWNEELIACVGQIARRIYDQEISHSSHNTLNKNYETIMAPYSFQKTVPSEKVGAIILKGFFALKNDIFVPTKRLPSANNLSLVISTQTFLADSKHIHGFLPLPLIPFELSKNHFFTALKEHSLIHMTDKSIIEESLTSSALLSNELIELLKWLCSSDINDRSYTKRVLSVVRYHETINSPISYFGKLNYYDALNISLVLPLPSNVLPISIAEHFSQEQLHHNLFLLPCNFKQLIDFYLSENQHYFGKLNYYDALNISLVLPLPSNILPISIAKDFSREQLHHNLFLLPCNFKQLIDFYLSENQQYLFNNVKTATHLLSYLSNSSSHFSEPEWIKIKSILSMIKCIPTTHGMKLPNESYLPSHILRSDRPAVTLNLLVEKTKDSQQPRNDSNENLVSVYFLKQIGCRMLDIQSIIENDSRMSSHNISALNHESMQMLIENLARERNSMSDADFNALKNTKFLQGTTLKPNRKNKQKYFPHDLHFPFVAEQLRWSQLIILDWHGIDSYSPEYAFLKEFGVREAPDLQILLKRIVQEHDYYQCLNKQRKETYKQPIALEFFAENFQKHYSTFWKTSNIQQPFLPSRFHTKTNDTDIILSAPDKVYKSSNPLYGTLLPEVVQLFEKHFNISLLGITEHPTLTQAFDIVMERKTELLTIESACHIFSYLNGLDGLNQVFIKRLSNIAFIPLEGVSTLMKPSHIFIKQQYRQNVKKKLAIASTHTPELYRNPLKTRLTNERWCLGFQPNNDNRKSIPRIVKPTEIYLDDYHQCIFTHHPICSPNDPELIKLYEQFGAQWLSNCVKRDLKHTGKPKTTDESKNLYELIRSRLHFLFVNNRLEPLASLHEEHFQSLCTNLSVYEVNNIKCQLTFQNSTKTLGKQFGSSCALEQTENEVALYFRKGETASQLDYTDIASELTRFVFKSPPETVIYTISDRLSSSLDSLRRRGVPVDDSLDTQIVAPTQTYTPLWKKALLAPFGLIWMVVHKKTNLQSSNSNIVHPQPMPSSKNQRRASDPAPVIHFPKDFNEFDVNNMNQMRHITDLSQTYVNPTFIQNEHTEEELSCSYVDLPAANMTRLENVDISIPLYLEQNITKTPKMIDQAKQLAWVLTGLADNVFQLNTHSLHLFCDKVGPRIAFNINGALFFNLRYFNQIFAQQLQPYLQKPNKENPIISTIVNFYFMVICHELAHNMYPNHDLSFTQCLQQLAVGFMIQKETFLRDFSFQNYQTKYDEQSF
ncbi:unnamed protein product [Rotaria magnacalcarata]|uniref:Uncharacterized protein n=3 Tax=Rotaria magnacalcarata TaxID=392030 RepID=A0A816AII2_9BILA|nr:unnamed protein product [Rotaria magnacalcarata]